MGNRVKKPQDFKKANKKMSVSDARMVELESTVFSGFLRMEALANLLIDKEILTKEEIGEKAIKLFEEYREGYAVEEAMQNEKAVASFTIPELEEEETKEEVSE